MGNETLNAASKTKNDEFYTHITDIERECYHYKNHFEGKTVYCNCDDPYKSEFFKYFAMNFNQFGLKKLIASCYIGSPVANTQLSLFDDERAENKTTKSPHRIEITEVADENADAAIDLADVELLLRNKKNALTRLQGDGDFRSAECIETLKSADIVVTNPPFSLFREYVAQLMEYEKKFLIIGNINAITYKEIFKLIKENKLWLGLNNGPKKYIAPDKKEYDHPAATAENGVRLISMGNTGWFTNLDVKKRHENLMLYKQYNPAEYPKYDNYDAIEVSKVSAIPADYDGVMGVPVTFLDKYNPEQFELLGSNRGVDQDPNGIYGRGSLINGKETFKRLFIKLNRIKTPFADV
jgi:hypothetical protein